MFVLNMTLFTLENSYFHNIQCERGAKIVLKSIYNCTRIKKIP